jgi:uncharacterized protein YjbI with pentapeptide repeats
MHPASLKDAASARDDAPLAQRRAALVQLPIDRQPPLMRLVDPAAPGAVQHPVVSEPQASPLERRSHPCQHAYTSLRARILVNLSRPKPPRLSNRIQLIAWASFLVLDMPARWLMDVGDTLVGNRGYFAIGSAVAAYFAVFGLIDAKSTQEETRASLERSLFTTLVSSGNTASFVAAMKDFGPTQTIRATEHPSWFRFWGWGRTYQPNSEPLRHWALWRLRLCDQDVKGDCGGRDPIRIELTTANLGGANLSGVQLSGADLLEANLSSANLVEADLSGAKFALTNLSGANLRRANLSNAYLGGANLTLANLSEADLRGANLGDADLSSADLSGAQLNRAYLSRANLRGANLRSVNLSDTNLRGVDLSGVDLRGVDLNNADLRGVNLRGANLNATNLDEGNLSSANLYEVNLSGAGLHGADLRDADMHDANLDGANLYEARNLTQAQLDDACGTDVKLPPGMTLKPCSK